MALNLDRISKTVERYMADSVTVERKTGEAMNPTTMVVTPTWQEIYTGVAFIAPMGDPEGTRLGGEDIERIQYEIAIPKDSERVLPNDRVTVDVSNDDSLVDTVFWVRDEIPTTFQTHRRLRAFRDVSAV
ncbi:MAG: hypothetical protein GTO63_16860 [Anaerolineae bacterium]|nr:hypothetical protein [Anaerolineae bacterium]NIN96469.1 hypothetical protein [Anaerolineae bacterium]